MTFADLTDRLRGKLRERIHNGEITERGFARQVGISQSHLHNIVGGVRGLSVSTADRILAGLSLAVLDLMEAGETRRGAQRVEAARRRAG